MGLREEIFEQPAVLEGLLADWRPVEALAAWIRGLAPSYVYLVGRGTSCHVGFYASYLWGSANRLPVAIAGPSLFTRYHAPPRLDGALVIGISQSGQSPDVVEVVAEARRQGRPTLAVVNDADSPLARAAEQVLAIGAGDERAVAATKTYTASLVSVAMLSAALADDAERRRQLCEVPDLATEVLGLDASIESAVERYRYMERCVVVGRGFDYATTHEWSLKLKELSYVVAERYSAADFRHGPIAIVAQGFPVLAVSAQGAVSADVADLLARLRRELDADPVVVSNVPAALEQARTRLELPARLSEWLSPIVSIVPCQLFAYHLTRSKGLDTETPRGLAKVTRTD